jgi:hypothetical protein
LTDSIRSQRLVLDMLAEECEDCRWDRVPWRAPISLLRTRGVAQIVLSGQRINNIFKTLTVELCVEYECVRLVTARIVKLHNVILGRSVF